MATYFEYGEKEIAHLKRVDKTFGAAIEQIGHIERPVIPDLFTSLIHSMVGQQISTKAMKTIWARMQKRFENMTPATMSAASPEEIQQCGMSMRKAGYIREAASKALNGELDVESLCVLPDDEVCKKLSSLNGIGVWTAEMLMIFSMQRPDVMSWDDLAIHRGLRMLYKHRKIDKKLFQKYKRRYSPYATVASLYLWAIAGGACNLKDHAPMTDAQQKKIRKNKVQKKKTFTLLDACGKSYASATPGTFGGNKKGKIYGKLDCPSALRAIAKGGYVKHRVFFSDEQIAIDAGYRPCAICLSSEYAVWKARKTAAKTPKSEQETGW